MTKDHWKALGGFAIITLLLLLCALAAAAPAGAKEPITICHKGQTLTVDDNALKGHLKHGDTEGPCVEQDTGETATRDWWLPNGGTPDNVTWPQPVYAGQTCGWVQRDTYKYGTAQQRAIVDALDDDGVLSGPNEDGPVYISHTWVQIGGCPEPTPTPTPTQPEEEPSPTPTEPEPTPTTPEEQPTTPESPTPTPTQSSTEPTSTPEPTVTAPASPPSSASPQPTTLNETSDEPLKPSVVSTQGPVQDVTRTELARTGTSPLPWTLGALVLIGAGVWTKWRSKNA